MSSDASSSRVGPDADWLTDLFGAHSGAVLRYARRRLDSVEDAEDVVVEVFGTAWRRRESIPTGAELPWLYATAAHVIAHTIRAEGRRTRLGARLATVRPLRDDISDDPAESIASATDSRRLVAAALDDLSESDAELLRLWAWEELTSAQLATVLDCSEGTARTRLHRARTRLREALAARGMDPATTSATRSHTTSTTSHTTTPTTPTHPRTGSEDPR